MHSGDAATHTQHFENLRLARKAHQEKQRREKAATGSFMTAGLPTLILIGAWMLMIVTLMSIKPQAEIVINTTRARVWKKVVNMGSWSAFDDRFQIDIPQRRSKVKLGDLINITSHDGSRSQAMERITVVEPPPRLCWDFEAVRGQLNGARSVRMVIKSRSTRLASVTVL